MNTTKSILRILILITLSAVAVFLIFSEPSEKDLTKWIVALFFSKSLGAVLAFAVGYLYKTWSKTDKWISAYEKSCTDALEAEL